MEHYGTDGRLKMVKSFGKKIIKKNPWTKEKWQWRLKDYNKWVVEEQYDEAGIIGVLKKHPRTRKDGSSMLSRQWT